MFIPIPVLLLGLGLFGFFCGCVGFFIAALCESAADGDDAYETSVRMWAGADAIDRGDA